MTAGIENVLIVDEKLTPATITSLLYCTICTEKWLLANCFAGL